MLACKENDDILEELYQNYLKNKDINKSADKYKLLDALLASIKGKSVKDLRKLFSLSHKKASELKAGSVQREKRTLKINDTHISKIKEFYNRSDISRIQPGEMTKRNGQTSYMRVTGKCAWSKFRGEYPDIIISSSVFWDIKPKNIKPLHKTPLNMCQCDKCANINLKLKVLKIPGIRNEQDLYKMLLCEKKGKFRHSNCVEQKCNGCKNWSEKIELEAISLDKDANVHWQRWENIEYVQKSGKTVTKKILKPKPGTVRDCLNELIDIDVLKPGQNISFVKHFLINLINFKFTLTVKNL